MLYVLVIYVLVQVWVEVVEVVYVTSGWVAECACIVCICFLCPYLWYETVCGVRMSICVVYFCATCLHGMCVLCSTLWYIFGVCVICMCTCTLCVFFVCGMCAVLFYIHKLYEVPTCCMWHVRVLCNLYMVCVVGV